MNDYLAFMALFWAFAFGMAVGWGIGKVGSIVSMLDELRKEK